MVMFGGAVVAANALGLHRARAQHQCFQSQNFSGEECLAALRPPYSVYETQSDSMWCWAASLAMVFKHYGYVVSQERIVNEALGAVWNVGVTGIQISQQLSRDWVDDNGSHFSSYFDGVYDLDAGVMALTDQMIIDALSMERPLILGTRSHAMVLVAVKYVPSAYGPEIIQAGLLDPWPGKGWRMSQPSEIRPMHRGGDLRYLVIPSIV
jgi:hypothetical protein